MKKFQFLKTNENIVRSTWILPACSQRLSVSRETPNSFAALPILVFITKKDYLQFDNLDEIAKNVMAFKKNLKAEIERWGVSKLSKETGIPQASLSRLLNSPSLPRRSTLEKIAKAMNLQESYLLSQWKSPKY